MDPSKGFQSGRFEARFRSCGATDDRTPAVKHGGMALGISTLPMRNRARGQSTVKGGLAGYGQRKATHYMKKARVSTRGSARTSQPPSPTSDAQEGAPSDGCRSRDPGLSGVSHLPRLHRGHSPDRYAAGLTPYAFLNAVLRLNALP